MFAKLLAKIVGTANERALKKLMPIVSQINAYEPQISVLTDEQLTEKTNYFRELLQKGKTLFPMVESNYLKVLEQMRKWVEDLHAKRILELEIRMCDEFIGLAGFMDRCDAVSHSQTAKDILRSQYRIIKKY